MNCSRGYKGQGLLHPHSRHGWSTGARCSRAEMPVATPENRKLVPGKRPRPGIRPSGNRIPLPDLLISKTLINNTFSLLNSFDNPPRDRMRQVSTRRVHQRFTTCRFCSMDGRHIYTARPPPKQIQGLIYPSLFRMKEPRRFCPASVISDRLSRRECIYGAAAWSDPPRGPDRGRDRCLDPRLYFIFCVERVKVVQGRV